PCGHWYSSPVSCVLCGCSLCRSASCISRSLSCFFYATAAAGLYTLSLHDALPISYRTIHVMAIGKAAHAMAEGLASVLAPDFSADRKSTRLNSSHGSISYAVFCLKKKKEAQLLELIPQGAHVLVHTEQQRVYQIEI